MNKYYHFILKEYYGRFGNNIIQISNMIYLGIITKSKLTFKNHPLIKINNLDFAENNKNLEKYTSKFFFDSQCLNISPNNDERRNIILKYIKPNLNINLRDNLENTLVIHIRSGCIFKTPHQGYLQPPFSFYQFIIDNLKPKNILIITEKDRNNPCINKLLKTYKCQIQSKTLLEDFQTLLSAKYLVSSNSTLCEMAILMSEKLEYLFTFEKIGIHNNINYFNFKFDNYIDYLPKQDGQKRLGNWKNTNEQLKLMNTHSKDNVILENTNLTISIDNLIDKTFTT